MENRNIRRDSSNGNEKSGNDTLVKSIHRGNLLLQKCNKRKSDSFLQQKGVKEL